MSAASTSRLQSGFIDPDALEWDQILGELQYDFYHLPGYARLCARQAGGEAAAYYATQGSNVFFQPLVIRRTPVELNGGETCDAASPYGYGGPLVGYGGDSQSTGELVDTGFIQRALDRLRSDLRSRSIVTLFVTLHPLMLPDLDAFHSEGTLILIGSTVNIDLTASTEELWSQTRSGHRSEINRARRNGYTAQMAPFDGYLDTFCSMYDQTMQRVGASERYLFNREYFQELKAALGDRLHLALVSIAGEPVCGGLFTEVNGIVQFHLAGTSDSAVALYPSKFMLDYVRSWAKDRGNFAMHLGSGLGGSRDSLFEFKAGFSKHTCPFYSWRTVCDSERYDQLVRRWEARTGTAADTPDGFFPAYRKD